MSEHWEGTPVTLARGSSPHRVRRLGKEVSVQQSGIEEVWKEVKLSGGSVLKNPPVMRETRVCLLLSGPVGRDEGGLRLGDQGRARHM